MDVLQQLTEKIRQKVGQDAGIRATIKFILDNDKYIFIDGRSVPNIVSNEDQPADCVIKISSVTLHEILQGRTSPTMAFMLGKLKVEGDMGVALKLTNFL